VALSLTETLTDAARQAVETSHWERDQQAWNLPPAPGEPIARGADESETDAEAGVADEPRADPRDPPEATE
jgi:hypothetical protein